MKTLTYPIKPVAIKNEVQQKSTASFPSSRYFQVHFEELHFQLRHTQHLVEQLSQKINQLQSELQQNQLNNQNST